MKTVCFIGKGPEIDEKIFLTYIDGTKMKTFTMKNSCHHKTLKTLFLSQLSRSHHEIS